MNTLTMLRRSFNQLRNNPLRTMLTLLGVVFGVGAVVAMMSIGEGAQRQILAQIEAMGATSVHIRARDVPDTELTALINDSVGLSRADVHAIEGTLPEVQKIAYRARHELGVTDLAVSSHEVQVLGVSEDLLDVHALSIARGRALSSVDHERGLRAAVIGDGLAKKAFPDGAIDKVFRLEYSYFVVVGVLAPTGAGGGGAEEGSTQPDELFGGGEDKDNSGGGGAGASSGSFDSQVYDNAVLIPFDTMVDELAPAKTFHELDMISVKVDSTDQTLETKNLLERLLGRLHKGASDFDIIAPEEILRQKQATQAVFNAVLISIAAISLIVGGIGVMNIMLANIMERISEIGLRRAIGARRRDIRNQFLLESVSICSVGGILGVLLGLGASWVVSVTIGLPMAFAWESTALSFVISLLVGVTFGLMPAVRAANVNPIDALRGD